MKSALSGNHKMTTANHVRKQLATAVLVIAVIDAHARSAMEFVNTTMAQPVAVAATNLPSFFENHVSVPDFFSVIATNTTFTGDEIFIFSATNSLDVSNYSNTLDRIHGDNNLRCILQRSGRVSDSIETRLAQSNYCHRLQQLATDIEQSGAITNQGIGRSLFMEILRTHYAYSVLDHEATIGALSYAITNGASISIEPSVSSNFDLVYSIATNGAFRVLGRNVQYYDPFRGGTSHVDLVVSTASTARPVILFLDFSHYGVNTASIEMYKNGYIGEALAEGVMEAYWHLRPRSPCPITLISSEQAEQLHAYGGTIRGSGLQFISGTPEEIVRKLTERRF